MGLDLDRIRDNYSKMDTDELLYIAKHEISSKNDNVIQIIKQEIKNRGLGSANIIKIIDNQNKSLTVEELNELVTLVKKSPCSICGNAFTPLQAAEIQKIRSFLLITTYTSDPLIGCNDCITNEKNKQLLLNFLLGWWSIPWGIIKTPVALISHFSKSNDDEILMQEFCKENQSEIILGSKKENGISKFLKHYHKY